MDPSPPPILDQLQPIACLAAQDRWHTTTLSAILRQNARKINPGNEPNNKIGLILAPQSSSDREALDSLRNYLSDEKLALNGRLPVERKLCELLGFSRARLRKALAVLEAEGQIWRHVGRGTFIGPRPVINLSDVEILGSRTSPTEVMEARLAMEPQLARLAALHGTDASFAEMRRCNRQCRAAREWRVYEAWDNNLHQAIAAATHNKLLVSLFDTLNIVRRSTVWGQLRSTRLPPADHASFREHDEIYGAIAERDPDRAADCMRKHLRTVRQRIMQSLDF